MINSWRIVLFTFLLVVHNYVMRQDFSQVFSFHFNRFFWMTTGREDIRNCEYANSFKPFVHLLINISGFSKNPLKGFDNKAFMNYRAVLKVQKKGWA